jgi:hypothetical protein
VTFDESVHQLPDTDPGETTEWLDSLDSVVRFSGKNRARYLLARLHEQAQRLNVSFPATISTPYVNTIPTVMNTLNAASVHTSDGMPQSWCHVQTKTLKESVGTCRRLQVQQVCTKWALIISFVEKKMVSLVTMSTFRDTQHRESTRVHF